MLGAYSKDAIGNSSMMESILHLLPPSFRQDAHSHMTLKQDIAFPCLIINNNLLSY